MYGKRNLNVKNMKEAIVRYSETQDDFNKIWETFRNMSTMGFITHDEFTRFYEECSGWYIDDGIMYDGNNDDAVVWDYHRSDYYTA